MRLDEYSIVQIVCDTSSCKYGVVPDYDMRTEIRKFIIEIYSGRKKWWECLLIGKDPAGKNIYLSFSSSLHAYMGYSSRRTGKRFSPCVREL